MLQLDSIRFNLGLQHLHPFLLSKHFLDTPIVLKNKYFFKILLKSFNFPFDAERSFAFAIIRTLNPSAFTQYKKYKIKVRNVKAEFRRFRFW